MISLSFARSIMPVFPVGLFLLLLAAVDSTRGVDEDVFQLVLNGQAFVLTANIWKLTTITKIACSSLCLARSCPGFCFNPNTRVCLVFVGSAIWVPLTSALGTRLYWIGGVLPTTTTTTTSTTTARVPTPGRQYFYYETKKGYDESKALCASAGGFLAAPISDVQWAVFRDTVGQLTLNGGEFVRLWADDIVTEGVWYWGPGGIPLALADLHWNSNGAPNQGWFAGGNDCVVVENNLCIDRYCEGPFGQYVYSCDLPIADCIVTTPANCYIP